MGITPRGKGKCLLLIEPLTRISYQVTTMHTNSGSNHWCVSLELIDSIPRQRLCGRCCWAEVIFLMSLQRTNYFCHLKMFDVIINAAAVAGICSASLTNTREDGLHRDFTDNFFGRHLGLISLILWKQTSSLTKASNSGIFQHNFMIRIYYIS